MNPSRHDIQLRQGRTFELPFALETVDGTVLDLPEVGDGYSTAWLHIRDTVNGELQLKATTANGRISLDPFTDANGTGWSGYVRIPASATVAKAEWGDGGYELTISDGLHTYDVLTGTAVLVPTNGPEEGTP